ncbi:MAG: hypothetical protein C3F12_07555 [Candidatus Methylomirabilota bacterium]|nr:hypothetical protein [candidate division NC10 bacterium]PWB45920.1 MAG: hypothetical protein C3F12_07555 [candidate division NC10 bacterium]
MGASGRTEAGGGAGCAAGVEGGAGRAAGVEGGAGRTEAGGGGIDLKYPSISAQPAVTTRPSNRTMTRGAITRLSCLLR